MEVPQRSIPTMEPEDELFHTCTKVGYSRAVIGKNYLYKIGKSVAMALELVDANSYTGHCFCRTSATVAANAGANSLQMKHHFRWQQEGTALKYIDGTRTRVRTSAERLTAAPSAFATVTRDSQMLVSDGAEQSTTVTEGKKAHSNTFKNVTLSNAT